ncbi:MAG TPA: nucleotide sugar dehydrogenase, partial [Candidatus Thermoplasmatota archaeon]|nr:nucleotide sugar dehydrogenase [Candidatus Thermoplasmatota archaeon]
HIPPNAPTATAESSNAPLTAPKVERVVVVGLGYVGLPAALCFARAGFDVTGVDINPAAVRAIERGQSPLPDAATDAEVEEAVKSGRFRATTVAADAVRDADLVTVCVPTPVTHDHKPDLVPLQKASEAIGKGLRAGRGTVVCYESTVFPGCTERECVPILERESGLKAGRDFGIAYCPERVNPGDPDHTTSKMARVLGAQDERSFQVAFTAYSKAIPSPIHRVRDVRTAEAVKVFENTQRDVNIALINEFARLCPLLGLDVHEVIAGCKTKFNFVPVSPGPGVGGHCIPVDPYYLIEEARGHGFEPRMMATAREVNDATTRHVATATLQEIARAMDPERAKVAVLGLAYKGGVADLRESPAEEIVKGLAPRVAVLAVHDPRIEPDRVLKATGIPAFTLEDAVSGSHAITIATDHPEFKELDWQRVAALAAPGAVVVDSRNVADPGAVKAAGLRYWGLGRGAL